MGKEKAMIWGLGAAAFLLVAPLVAASCQATSQYAQKETTMMKSNAKDVETKHLACACASTGKECGCDHCESESSRGGEDAKEHCAEKSQK